MPSKPKTQAPAEPTTRVECNARLDELGWDGPRSYTVRDTVELLLPWIGAGCSPDAAHIPPGAMNHAHPVERAARPAKRGKGYLAAMTEVRDLLKKGTTMKALTAHVDGLLVEVEVEEAVDA